MRLVKLYDGEPTVFPNRKYPDKSVEAPPCNTTVSVRSLMLVPNPLAVKLSVKPMVLLSGMVPMAEPPPGVRVPKP